MWLRMLVRRVREGRRDGGDELELIFSAREDEGEEFGGDDELGRFDRGDSDLGID